MSMAKDYARIVKGLIIEAFIERVAPLLANSLMMADADTWEVWGTL